MEYADLVILNGKVLTVNEEFSIEEAIAVKNGLILAVGTSNEIKKMAGEQTKIIDLNGKTILPGAHDAHIHASLTGALLDPSFFNLTYPTIHSLKELKAKLSQRVQKTTPGRWIYGLGWDTAYMDEFNGNPTGMITKYDLDDVSPENPVCLIHYSCNLLIANSKAMELAGITKDNSDINGIVKDPNSGAPIGVFMGFVAGNLITKHMPIPSCEEMKNAIKWCQRELNKNGFTSHTDAGLGIGGEHLMAGMWGTVAIDAYEELRKNDELTCRVSIGILPVIDSVHSYENTVKGLSMMDLYKYEHNSDWIRYWLKIRADGMPIDYSVWMSTVQRCGHHGRSNFPGETDNEQYEDFLKTVKYLHKNGWQIGAHAMGDLMVKKCIDAFSEAMDEYPKQDLRHYIIHAELITKELAEKCKKYNIGLSMQPTNDMSLFNMYNELFTWEDGDIFEDMAPIKMLMDTGVNIAGGSDAPVSLPNWRESVQAAVTRKCVLDGKIYGEKNAISVEDGIRMFTINGSIQEHAEKSRGSIEVDKVADFQVLGQDILTVDKYQIGKIPVVMTIIEGKVVYTTE